MTQIEIVLQKRLQAPWNGEYFVNLISLVKRHSPDIQNPHLGEILGFGGWENGPCVEGIFMPSPFGPVRDNLASTEVESRHIVDALLTGVCEAQDSSTSCDLVRICVQHHWGFLPILVSD